MKDSNSDLEGRTFPCVNETEKFWKSFYLVSLTQCLSWDSAICVNADHEQDALDYAVDYAEEQGWLGYFVDETDVRHDKHGEEIDTIRAGNHCLALNMEEVNIRRIPERFVFFPSETQG